MVRVIGKIVANCPVCNKEYIAKAECPVCHKLYEEPSGRVDTKFGGILVCPRCEKRKDAVAILEAIPKVRNGYDEIIAIRAGKAEVQRVHSFI
jgi:ssDNA-binding Zn-finger/Zn-ribbon topoisomerase 1